MSLVNTHIPLKAVNLSAYQQEMYFELYISCWQSLSMKTLLKIEIPLWFNGVVGSTKYEGGNTNFRIKVPLATG